MRFYNAMFAALVCAFTAAPLAAEPGALVIVGGGLEPDNAAIYQAFLNARPESAPAIVIIPAASGEPSSSAKAARAAMVQHGARESDIMIAEIAVMDDPYTRVVNEAGWANNITSADEIARIQQAGAIWFTGGDQARITALLLAEDGSDTPYLAALRARHRQGAVIGGTSAGAAIMSGAMIGGGDAMGALLGAEVGEELVLVRGLHFLRGPLVDQHFGERARLGRLAAALIQLRKISPMGLGIDENTALLVAPDQLSAQVIGSGYVTVLDASGAARDPGVPAAILGLVVGLAGPDDTINLATGDIEPSWNRPSTLGREYASRIVVPTGGMAIGRGTLADVIGEDLLDNSSAQQVVRYSFAGNRGIAYRFTQTAQSKGAFGRYAVGAAYYTVSGVQFDIVPIGVTINEAGE